jgi:hypothetical protein
MKFLKRKTEDSLIALILMLTITTTSMLVALPLANAHDPAWSVPTWTYVAISPDPIGVGQTATVVFWVDKVPPGAAGVAGERWLNLKVEVTKPNGVKESL